ncbi:hypothetical protein A1O7_05088 [Cladophialophora yegresii CBS 114405]|uniref:Uncharacterized protein n=1 Tax=Cladophialophora yegresii CBS 114405 TaxID=1182544 RepID=W9W7G9_9EURO|nr:uncharacterized protein A1O7_05088 [Cladophialophora yegresii CBS 114405]EXJ60935.1 hypothetical protein A1O7_05088 [Cladophialophora yegresii CBS 114405]
MTVRNDPTLLAQITDLVATALQDETFARGEPVLQAGMLVQPLTLPHLRYAKNQAQAHAQAQGQAQEQKQGQGHTNLMLLDDEDEALILLSLEIHYLNASHTERYTALLNNVLSRAEDLARSSTPNALHPFRYVNYAAQGQDVWGMLREKESGMLELVRDVQRRYDCQGIFERMLSGGFRIGKLG